MWFNAASQMQERSIELQLHNCEEVDITPSKRTTLWNHTVGVLQMIYYRCYYVLMACIDVTMHLMACSTASTTPHCLACCMCMHRLPMCISGRERWGWALELRSEVTLKFCTYESCLISKYTVVWGPRWYHFFDLGCRFELSLCNRFCQ